MGVISAIERVRSLFSSPKVVILATSLTNLSALLLAILILPLGVAALFSESGEFYRILATVGVYALPIISYSIVRRRPAISSLHSFILDRTESQELANKITGAFLIIVSSVWFIFVGYAVSNDQYTTFVDSIMMLLLVAAIGALFAGLLGLLLTGIVLVKLGDIRYNDRLMEVHAEHSSDIAIDANTIYDGEFKRVDTFFDGSTLKLQILQYIETNNPIEYGRIVDSFSVPTDAIDDSLRKLLAADLIEIQEVDDDLPEYRITDRGRVVLKYAKSLDDLFL